MPTAHSSTCSMPTIHGLHLVVQELGRKPYLLANDETAPADISAFKARWPDQSSARGTTLLEDIRQQHPGMTGYAALHLLGRNSRSLTREHILEELGKLGVPAPQAHDAATTWMEGMADLDENPYPQANMTDEQKETYALLGLLNGRILTYCTWADIALPVVEESGPGEEQQDPVPDVDEGGPEQVQQQQDDEEESDEASVQLVGVTEVSMAYTPYGLGCAHLLFCIR